MKTKPNSHSNSNFINNLHSYGCSPQEPKHSLFSIRFVLFCMLFLSSFITEKTYALQGNDNSHDPSALIKDGNRYWQFTTGQGIYGAYSYDLINWTPGPNTVFPIGTWPSWINNYAPKFAGEFWAPDAIYMNGKYHLYYSCTSEFGSKQSVIGLVTNVTLDPNSPNYKWVDEGMVVYSTSTSPYNAIDPALFRDSDGRVYLSYGSFYGGIAVIEIDQYTGKMRSSTNTSHLAGGGNADWEAPYIIKEGSYYYLFINRGYCCRELNSTYYIVMGRSTNIRGPYVDKNGVDLRSGGGTVALGRSGKYIGPGHYGLLRENGSNFVSIHYYDGNDNGNAKLDILNMGFSGGWPFLTRDWVANGQYKVANKHSNLVWDAWGCTGANGQAIAQGPWGGYDCQKWNFTALGDGVYKITNQLGGRSVDVQGCSTANGAPLQLWDWLDNNCQKFKIERAADGSHFFTSLINNKVIDVPGASTSAGTQLTLYSYNGNNNQKWSITSASTNTLAIDQVENETMFDRIYPNPAKGGTFTVDLGKNENGAVLNIVNVQGKTVYTQSLQDQKTDISANLKTGMYVVQIRRNDKVITKKLLIE